MSTDLVPWVPAGGDVQTSAPGLRDLLTAFLAGRSPRTLRAYRQDLADFAASLGAPSAEAAATRLLGGGAGAANLQALGYRAQLRERGLAAATINRRLAALRSLVKMARTLGLANFALEVDGVKAEGYRDTRGPGRRGFLDLLSAIPRSHTPKGKRDVALLRLLYDLGLRRQEAVGLDRADVDLARGAVEVLGKGRSQKERLTLPEPTAAAIAGWLALRGDGPGPLFYRLDRAGNARGRLTGSSVYRIVRQLGLRAGIQARPHGLRHAAITEALDLTGGDVRAVQRFSRHRNLNTLQKYDDNRRDLGGDVARRVAGGARAPE